jgi:hypothetical protein
MNSSSLDVTIGTLQAPRDIRKVALWLGRSDMRATETYLRVDQSEELEATFGVQDRFAPCLPALHIA